MSSEKHVLTVIYVVIPLIILTAFLPLLVALQQQDIRLQYQQNVLLYPRVIQRDMGLVTPCSSSDAVYKDYEAVQTVLNDIPDAYMHDNTAVGTAATITKLKTLLSTTDRSHVAAHGSWNGMSVVSLDSSLTYIVVNGWTQQGYRCEFIVLSACNSMGHDGIQNNQLASAISTKSGVEGVIGYKNLVDAAGSAIIAATFWALHLWANEGNGGISSSDAFYDAKDVLHGIIVDASLTAMWSSVVTSVLVATVVAIVFSVILPVLIPSAPAVYAAIAAVVSAVLSGLFMYILFYFFLNALDSAYTSVVKYGASVPGLTYSGGGGGGGDLPE